MDAIALFSGPLEATIKTFKYGPGGAAWASIFGRLILGWMEANPHRMDGIDLVLGNPTAPGRNPLQHIETMMQATWAEDRFDRWPLPHPNRPVLVKTRQTEKSASSKPSWNEKLAAAKSHAEALELRGAVSGKRLLLVDDVFTTGAQFMTVSRFLVEKGEAADVSGLVLARTPW